MTLTGHSFKPVTTGESIQVAILDELQQIRSLLEPSELAVDMEPVLEPLPDNVPAAGEPEPKSGSKEPPVKKATTRKRVTGQ